jgi:hypothetical protein
MKLRDPLTVLLVTVLVGSFGGCSCRSTERNSPTVKSPVGRWVSAYATVEYHPSFYKNGHDHPPSVLHSLSIGEDDLINLSYVILTDRYENDTAASQFRDLRDTTYTLRFSADDHMLAASTDGGHAWTLFDLESLGSTTTDPFWCRHRSVASLDPWPSMDGLALEILGAVDPASPNARVHQRPTSVEWPGAIHDERGSVHWEDELLGAFRHACFHREDPALRAGVIAAFFHKEFKLNNGEVDQCLGEIAKVDPATKARLEEMQSSGDTAGQARAKSALYYVTQPSPGPYKPPVRMKP